MSSWSLWPQFLVAKCHSIFKVSERLSRVAATIFRCSQRPQHLKNHSGSRNSQGLQVRPAPHFWGHREAIFCRQRPQYLKSHSGQNSWQPCLHLISCNCSPPPSHWLNLVVVGASPPYRCTMIARISAVNCTLQCLKTHRVSPNREAICDLQLPQFIVAKATMLVKSQRGYLWRTAATVYCGLKLQ